MKLNTKSLKDVEIGIPVIADGVYHVRLKAEVKENKEKSGNNLYIQAKVLDPEVMSHEGKLLTNTGNIVLFRYISLVPTDKYDPDRSLKELQIAIGLAPEEDLEVEHLQDKIVVVKVAYKPAEKGYRESNDIKGFSPLKPEDTFDTASVPF